MQIVISRTFIESNAISEEKLQINDLTLLCLKKVEKKVKLTQNKCVSVYIYVHFKICILETCKVYFLPVITGWHYKGDSCQRQ